MREWIYRVLGFPTEEEFELILEEGYALWMGLSWLHE